jgi:serine/threonine protein kinase
MTSAQPGDLLVGRYRLHSVIGRGGMGVVWLAGDEMLSRDVAVKETIRPPDLSGPEWHAARERSLSEARAAARLSHHNIVTVYDVIEHHDRPWIVMELVPYPSLSEVIRDRGSLTPGQAASVGLRLLSALRAAHGAGVLHRDVKPSNVLLGPDGRVVLTDFGLAVIDAGPGMTVSGQITGSPAFMAPERARGERATPASDLWSLGATLYAAVEGRDPFQRNSTIAVLTAVVSDPPNPPELAGTLWPVLSGLLRKDPWSRLCADQTELMLRQIADAAGAAADVLPIPSATLADADLTGGQTRQYSASAAPIEAAPQRRLYQHAPRRRGRSLIIASVAGLVTAAAMLLFVFVVANSAAWRSLNSPGHSTTPATQSRTGPAPSASPPSASSSAVAAKQSGHVPGHRKHHGHGDGKGHGEGGDDGDSQ